MLLLSHSLPEREGGGGAPLVFALDGACATQESGSWRPTRRGTVGLGYSYGVPRRGTP